MNATEAKEILNDQKPKLERMMNEARAGRITVTATPFEIYELTIALKLHLAILRNVLESLPALNFAGTVKLKN
jgi:hypothetical protein